MNVDLNAIASKVDPRVKDKFQEAVVNFAANMPKKEVDEEGLKVFQFESSNVRTVIGEDGEPWFVAKDVAGILGYANPQKAVRDHCREPRAIGGNESFTLDPQTIIIPEHDMYRLVMRSKLPSAEKFETWVVKEVLPSIRKTGSYGVPQGMVVIDPRKNESSTLRYLSHLMLHSAEQAEEITKLRPKAEKFDQFMDADNAQPISVVAKVLGFRPRKFFKELREKHILAGKKGSIPYQSFIDRGYGIVREVPIKQGSKIVNHPQGFITPSGVTYLSTLFGKH